VHDALSPRSSEAQIITRTKTSVQPNHDYSVWIDQAAKTFVPVAIARALSFEDLSSEMLMPLRHSRGSPANDVDVSAEDERSPQRKLLLQEKEKLSSRLAGSRKTQESATPSSEALHTASDPSLDQRRATVSVDEPAIRPERVPPTPRYKTTFEHPSARSTLPQKANQPQDRYQAAITTTTSVHVERITTTRLVCFLPSCTHIVYDVSPTTLLCWTCGLQSITRYCGPQHRLEDLARHYTTCKPSPLPTMYANWSWPDRFDPEINWQMAPRDTNSRSRFAH